MSIHSSFSTPDVILKTGSALGINSLAIITSFQQQVEWWLRIASLLAAIAYTIVLIYKALKTRPATPES
jgi:hypothetical protein